MPTYQRRDVVCDAVRALCGLDYAGAVDVIVVVDGSSDGTAEALRTLQCPFPLRILEQENCGAGHARNRGAASATGDVLFFLDDDMIAEPDLIEQHAKMYREGADAVVGHIPVDRSSPPGFLRDAVADWIESSRVAPELTPFDIFTGQLSVRRTVFEALGGFDDSYTRRPLFAHEDTEFGARLLATYNARYNPNAISSQKYVLRPRELMRRSAQAAQADKRFLASHPEYAAQLFEHRGASRKRTRFLYRPLGRIPLLPQAAAELGVRMAQMALRTPFRSNRFVATLFSASRGLLYWSKADFGAAPGQANRLLVSSVGAMPGSSLALRHQLPTGHGGAGPAREP